MEPIKPEKTGMRLAGRQLFWARAAWAAAAGLILAVFLLALPVRIQALLQDPYQFRPVLARLDLGISFFVLYASLLEALLVLACLGIAVLILWRKSDDGLGLLVSMGLLCFISLLPVIPALGDAHPTWRPAIFALRTLCLLVILLVFYLFPDGRFVPIWMRYVFAGWFLILTALLFIPGFSPPDAPVDLKTWNQAAGLLILLTALSTGVFAQGHRFTCGADTVQRQQTKWVVFGFFAVFAGLALISLPAILFPVLRAPGFIRFVYVMLDIPISLLAWFLLPLSLTFSILKYRLWDIDIIISRTLSYGALTITLALLYFGGVVLLQGLSRIITNENQSSIAIVISTLAIAAAFTPLRQRIQNGIDRRFYRQKVDADEMLREFARLARDEVELEKLTDEVLLVIDETFHPDEVDLWLCPIKGQGYGLFAPIDAEARKMFAKKG